jgi:hypothetical protein
MELDCNLEDNFRDSAGSQGMDLVDNPAILRREDPRNPPHVYDNEHDDSCAELFRSSAKNFLVKHNKNTVLVAMIIGSNEFKDVLDSQLIETGIPNLSDGGTVSL